jgi:hypothetical protein
MQQECAARLQQTVCQRKKLHTKSKLAAHLKVCEKYAIGVCSKVAANCVPEKKKSYEKYTCCTLAANCVAEVCGKIVPEVFRKQCAREKICIYEKHTCGKLAATSCSTLAAKKQVRYVSTVIWPPKISEIIRIS